MKYHIKPTQKLTLIYNQGNGGTIYKVHQLPYVLKKPHESKIYLHKNEINILSQLEHPNIIRLINSSEKYLITEFANGYDLFHWIHPIYGIELTSNNIRAIIKPIVTALIYTNTINISHRDIKLENIVIHDGIPKLIDWGFACKDLKSSKKRLGTCGYLSLQIIQNKTYSPEKNDVWALGVVIFSLHVQRSPYATDKIDDYFQAIIDYKWTLFWNSHIHYDKKNFTIYNDHIFRNLIENMLNPDENARFDLQQVLNHEWFTQESSTTEEIKQLQKKISAGKYLFD